MGRLQMGEVQVDFQCHTMTLGHDAALPVGSSWICHHGS